MFHLSEEFYHYVHPYSSVYPQFPFKRVSFNGNPLYFCMPAKPACLIPTVCLYKGRGVGSHSWLFCDISFARSVSLSLVNCKFCVQMRELPWEIRGLVGIYKMRVYVKPTNKNVDMPSNSHCHDQFLLKVCYVTVLKTLTVTGLSIVTSNILLYTVMLYED